MKKLLLAVLCSLPLLPALARADDTKTSSGDAMQGDGMMQGGSVQQGGHMDSDMKK